MLNVLVPSRWGLLHATDAFKVRHGGKQGPSDPYSLFPGYKIPGKSPR